MLATLRRAYRAVPLSARRRAGLRSLLMTVGQTFSSLAPVADPGTFPTPKPAHVDKPDFLFFGVIDWHFRTQRPQHLAAELVSAGHRVFYFSNEFIARREAGFRVEPLGESGRLFQVRLYASGAPAIYHSRATPSVERQLGAGLRGALAWANARQFVRFVQHPFWGSVVASLSGALVYDCMDFHEGFDGFGDDLRQAERLLIREADLTVVTSVWLEQFVRPFARRIALIRNAAEYGRFAQVPVSLFRDPRGRAVLGYYGALAEWFDEGLVRAIAERFTDCLVLLVGHDQSNVRRALRGLENVRFMGEVPYHRLPLYLHGFDVCLLPFRIVPLTLATNPVKLYEYLSAGKPVVSTALPEAAVCKDLVHVAGSKQEFLDHIGEALSERDAPQTRHRRQAFAAEQTWSNRGQELLAAVATILA